MRLIIDVKRPLLQSFSIVKIFAHMLRTQYTSLNFTVHLSSPKTPNCIELKASDLAVLFSSLTHITTLAVKLYFKLMHRMCVGSGAKYPGFE